MQPAKVGPAALQAFIRPAMPLRRYYNKSTASVHSLIALLTLTQIRSRKSISLRCGWGPSLTRRLPKHALSEGGITLAGRRFYRPWQASHGVERWNVERRDTDSRKSERRKAGTDLFTPPIRQLEHGGNDNVPPTWNAENRLDTLATAGTTTRE